jgi:hypothetical protein
MRHVAFASICVSPDFRFGTTQGNLAGRILARVLGPDSVYAASEWGHLEMNRRSSNLAKSRQRITQWDYKAEVSRTGPLQTSRLTTRLIQPRLLYATQPKDGRGGTLAGLWVSLNGRRNITTCDPMWRLTNQQYSEGCPRRVGPLSPSIGAFGPRKTKICKPGGVRTAQPIGLSLLHSHFLRGVGRLARSERSEPL